MIIYQFKKSFLDNKMSIFEEYGAFKRFSIFKETRKGSAILKESGDPLCSYLSVCNSVRFTVMFH